MAGIVRAENLVKYFHADGGVVRAVDDVSFQIDERETVGLVGESGCGKSTIGRTILNLIEPGSGKLFFKGQNIYEMDKTARRTLRKEMGIVFQNPYSSLNPRMKVRQIVGEPIQTHHGANGKKLREKVAALLEQVGLKPEHLNRFPHQFSGGQRQRIAIARSLALDPRFLILDEPTSALDVSVQAQVLNLINRLQKKKHLTYLFITHDLHVVHHIADKVIVMYLGKIVESGPVDAVFDQPLHPYTRALLDAIPNANPLARRRRVLLEGDAPSPINPPPGCRFHTRCPRARSICREQEPESREMNQRRVACHLVGGAGSGAGAKKSLDSP
ncbi:MAG: dipeptide ABC transporter ATP-binding protein [Desulfobacterales bacterium]|nr:dipeptide ABC transporter ATP-binding protein [Desulfobacterales bacterium]